MRGVWLFLSLNAIAGVRCGWGDKSSSASKGRRDRRKISLVLSDFFSVDEFFEKSSLEN